MRPGRVALLLTASVLAGGCLAPARPVAPPPAVEAPPPGPPTVQDTAWQFPIAGGTLPEEPELLPNAEREYRGGIHQGVDLFFLKSGGDPVVCGTPVVNAHTGTVTRADRDWRPMTVREYENTIAALRADGPHGATENETDAGRLDRLRGRQVWVACDDGTLIRYCHLQAVDPSIDVGLKIAHGIRIGTVGNSGTADGAAGTSRNCHLHFEVWPTPDAWLGKGRSASAARRAYAALFGPDAPSR